MAKTIFENKIINYLKMKNIYDETDDTLIEELRTNLLIMNECKKDIKKRGVVVPISNSHLLGTNPSCNTYSTALKNFLSISKKLSLSPQDRIALKLEFNGFDDDF